MKNYEYIIASLPDLATGSGQTPDVDGIIAEIRERLADEGQVQGRGGSDLDAMQTVLDGFDSGKLTPAFYEAALSSKNGFIREYFLFDLNVRNSKVAFLNEETGRPEGTDIMYPCADVSPAAPGTVTAAPDGCTYEPGGYDEEAQVRAVLKGSDILGRERGLDDIMWAKVEQLTTLHVFDLDIILGCLVRLKIMDRWLKLDPAAGRELFQKLVSEIRNTR